MNDTWKRIEKVFREVLSVPTDKAIPDKDADLIMSGLDDLDGVELTMGLEEEFDVSISDSEHEKCTTLQNYYDLINSKLTKN